MVVFSEECPNRHESKTAQVEIECLLVMISVLQFVFVSVFLNATQVPAIPPSKVDARETVSLA